MAATDLRIQLIGKGVDEMWKLAQRLENKAIMYPAFARALNHTGNVAKTAVYKQLAVQTGLKIKTTRKAVKMIPANAGRLEAILESRGGDVGLKYFGARETRAGVSAAPFGSRKTFAGTFIKGGRFPKRKVLAALNRHVWTPSGGSKRWGRPFSKTKSGVIIPNEMVQGATADAFMRIADERLPARVLNEVKRISGGLLA